MPSPRHRPPTMSSPICGSSWVHHDHSHVGSHSATSLRDAFGLSCSRPIALALGDGLTTGHFGLRLRLWSRRRPPTTGERRHLSDWLGLGLRSRCAQTAADVVNLGFVVNVIERPLERVAALLRSAWKLTNRLLVVAARLGSEGADARGRSTVTASSPRGDLPEAVHAGGAASLDRVEPRCPVHCRFRPCVFYVFRHDAEAQRFLSSRFRHKASVPKPQVSERLYEAHRPLFDRLANSVTERGRLPLDEELEVAADIRRELGGIPKAFAILRRIGGFEQWQQIAEERARDLLVYLALANFGGRPRSASSLRSRSTTSARSTAITRPRQRRRMSSCRGRKPRRS